MLCISFSPLKRSFTGCCQSQALAAAPLERRKEIHIFQFPPQLWLISGGDCEMCFETLIFFQLGMNANDNGYLGFRHHRIPRSALLNKNARLIFDTPFLFFTHSFSQSVKGVTLFLKLSIALAIKKNNFQKVLVLLN